MLLVQKYNVKSSAKLDKLKRQLCKLFCYHTYMLQGISYGLEKFERAIVFGDRHFHHHLKKWKKNFICQKNVGENCLTSKMESP